MTLAEAMGRPVTEFTSCPEMSPCVVCEVAAAAQRRNKNTYAAACLRATRPVYFESMFSSVRLPLVFGCAAGARFRIEMALKRDGRTVVVRCRLP